MHDEQVNRLFSAEAPNTLWLIGNWSGKPDVYHALQATLLPRLPLSPMFAAALRSPRGP